MHTCTHTPTRTHPHTQINHKHYGLGLYAVEADAAAARDVVARVLGYPLNFKKTRKITGQRSKGADQAVADAVKAANAFVLGNSTTFEAASTYVAANGKFSRGTSIYTGVNKDRSSNRHPWKSVTTVSSEQSSKNMGCI